MLVVDAFEAIQIDKTEGNCAFSQIRLVQLLGENLSEFPAVGQIGEGIVVRRFFKAFLVLLLLMVQPFALDQVAEGLQQRLELFGQFYFVSAETVRQPHQSNLLIAGKHRNTDIGINIGVPLREPAAARVGRDIAGNDHLPRGHGKCNQGVQAIEHKPPSFDLLIQRLGFGVPGNIGDRSDFQIRGAILF